MTYVCPTGTDNWKVNPVGAMAAAARLGDGGDEEFVSVNAAPALVTDPAALATTTV
jgi:hypothetical protein